MRPGHDETVMVAIMFVMMVAAVPMLGELSVVPMLRVLSVVAMLGMLSVVAITRGTVTFVLLVVLLVSVLMCVRHTVRDYPRVARRQHGAVPGDAGRIVRARVRPRWIRQLR